MLLLARDQDDSAEEAPRSTEGPSCGAEETPAELPCRGYGPPPVCDICEHVILDPHDPMEFGVCQACWQESYERGGVQEGIERPERPGEGEDA